MRLNISTLALSALGIGFLLFGYARVVHRWTPWQIVGLTIFLPAYALFAWARLQLGSAFSLKAKASRLVTGGIYARIRNPIYIFGGLMMVGIFTFAHRPWWLLMLVILIPVQLRRARKEEQVLAAKFGDAYLEYKQKTWF